MDIEEFMKIDNNFSQSMFLTKVNNIFVRLFTCIMMDKLDEVKHFISQELYTNANNIINSNKANNLRQMYDELNVKQSTIQNIKVFDDYYEITVLIESKYLDYKINLDSGDTCSGNPNCAIYVNYKLTLRKKATTKAQGIARKCPGCGAPISVNTSGKCSFCGAIYNQDDYDWVLIKLTRI